MVLSVSQKPEAQKGFISSLEGNLGSLFHVHTGLSPHGGSLTSPPCRIHVRSLCSEQSNSSGSLQGNLSSTALPEEKDLRKGAGNVLSRAEDTVPIGAVSQQPAQGTAGSPSLEGFKRMQMWLLGTLAVLGELDDLWGMLQFKGLNGSRASPALPTVKSQPALEW